MENDYAVNEDGVTVYQKSTGEAVCVCGPEPAPGMALAFNKDRTVCQMRALTIARALNETAARSG